MSTALFLIGLAGLLVLRIWAGLQYVAWARSKPAPELRMPMSSVYY